MIITFMWSIWMHNHNRKTHDQEIIDPASSVTPIREDLALLDIPQQTTIPLPGHGWWPPKQIMSKSALAQQFSLMLVMRASEASPAPPQHSWVHGASPI